MLANAQTFIDVPYVAHTLETDGEEDLVINCDEVDCTTFVEYVLALSLPSASGNKMSESDFAANLQRIRYREGKIDGYTSVTTLPIGSTTRVRRIHGRCYGSQ